MAKSHRVHISETDIRDWQAALTLIGYFFDLLPDHIVITDPNGNVVYANKAVQRQTGFSPDEVLGHNPGDLWGGQMPEEFYKQMWQTISNDKLPWAGEVKNIRKDGQEYWQELRVTPVLGEDGEVAYYIGIEPDITARKSKEAQLRDILKKVDELTTRSRLRIHELEERIEKLRQQQEE